MTPAVRRRLAAALVALVALATVGAVAVPGAGAQQRRVVVVGDSVILGAQGPITSSFTSRGWAVTFDAAVSRSTSAGLDAIESHRAELTDSLVVNLGANDAGNTAAYRQKVQAILDATAGVPHVYWLTIREVRDYYGPANQVVRDLAASRPNVTVVDWHGATAGATDLTAGDGLHLNGAGAARMAQVVTDAVVAGALPAAAPPPAPAPPPAAPPTTAAPTTTPPTTAAPSTTAAPTTSAPTTTVDDRDEAATELAERDVRDVGESTLADGDTIWTVGGGFALVVVLLALGGVVLAVWALARSGRADERTMSAAHPAVRARQRAQRIAEATAEAGAEPGTGVTAEPEQVEIETQKT